jgi:O-antigen/teichoic acid export membrane protein
MLSMLAMFAGDIPAARLASTAGEDRRAVLSTYVWTTVATSVAIALVLLPFAGVIARTAWDDPPSAGIALLAILLIPIGTVQATLLTTERLDGHAGWFAALASIDLLGQMVLAVIFVLVGWGALGMVLGFVTGSAVGLIAVAVHRREVLATRPDWAMGRAMLTEGIRFLPATLGFVVATYAVRYLLVDWDGQTAVGLFGVASRLASGMALRSGAFSMAWGPYGLGLPDNIETARLFGRVIRTYAWVAVLASAALAAAAPELVRIVSGDAYADAALMLPGLLAAAAMSGAFYVLLVAAGISRRGGSVAIAALIGSSAQVFSTLLLLPVVHLGAVGFGATVGQAVALLILAGAVRTSVHAGISAVAVLCVGGVLIVAMEALNAAPEPTQAPRMVIAVASAVAAVWLMWRLLNRRTTGQATA